MKTLRMTLFMKLALLAFVLFCLITILQLRMEFNELTEKGQLIREQIEKCEDHIEELNERLEEKFDEDYIEKVARDQMNYCKPDEMVIYNDR